MDLKERFTEYTKNWQDKLNEDEWYFCKFRDEFTKDLMPHEAFDLIPDVIELLFNQSDEYLVNEVVELLLTLIRLADTTEIRPTLAKHWNQIVELLSSSMVYNKNRLAELKKLLRKE